MEHMLMLMLIKLPLVIFKVSAVPAYALVQTIACTFVKYLLLPVVLCK